MMTMNKNFLFSYFYYLLQFELNDNYSLLLDIIISKENYELYGLKICVF